MVVLVKGTPSLLRRLEGRTARWGRPHLFYKKPGREPSLSLSLDPCSSPAVGSSAGGTGGPC
jgi:hypothetical protein